MGEIHNIKINSEKGQVLIDDKPINGITELKFSLEGGYNRKGSITLTLDAKCIEVEGKVLFTEDLNKLKEIK